MSRYAIPTDLQSLSLVAAALTGISGGEQQTALDTASGVADGYLASRYSLPLTAYGQDLVRAVCNIAAYDLMSVRGYSPDGTNSTIRDRYDDAIRWLERVAGGLVSPVGIADSSMDASGATTGQFVHQARADEENVGAFVVGVPEGRGW